MAEGQATLHMLCGKIAAGKSTLAARLADAPRTVLISEDHLLTSLYPGEILTPDDFGRRERRLQRAIGPHIISLLEAGLSVVLDFQANTPAARAWMRSLFEAADAGHALHHLRASDEACLARLRARNAAGAHPCQVSDADFERFTRFFVPPAEEEGFNVVVHEDGQDQG